jgi:hypothetical protein
MHCIQKNLLTSKQYNKVTCKYVCSLQCVIYNKLYSSDMAR